MAEFNILDHLDALEPDGGSAAKDEGSYLCPACGAKNFKVEHSTGKWNTFTCDCATTEDGKRRIRNAICPARNPNHTLPVSKPIRPSARRHWDYFTPQSLKEGTPALRVHRTDDGKGCRKFWQESLGGSTARPADIAASVLPYRLAEALTALDDGAPYVYWVEGEGCADALWAIDLPAVTSIGGAGKFKPERDAGHLPPDRLVVVPDRDQPGLKHADTVAAAHPGCRWLYPFPGTEQWNGKCPESQGLDIADWIAQGATVENILSGVGKKLRSKGEPLTPQERLDEWDQLLADLVNPDADAFERNTVRRQIIAATRGAELNLRASPQQVRARLLSKQRELITGTTVKGTAGGQRVKAPQKQWLINQLIPKHCLTGVAAFAKVGKTKFLVALAASLIFQQPFMGNPDWQPAPGPHRIILWLTDQPAADTNGYLKAVGLMESDGTLHPSIVKLYTEEDDLCWDDQGVDQLLADLQEHPDATLISDSFFANVQRAYGSDKEPEAAGALIDLQTLLSQSQTTHVLAFHSPKETGLTGANAIRGHSSAAGVPSAVVSLHFLERRDPSGNGKWVADKENNHRRLVVEGRAPYRDLLVRLHGLAGRWEVVGDYIPSLAELQSDDAKGSAIQSLTEGQRETLEWVAVAIGIWKDPSGVTVQQVANAKCQPLNREATRSEIEQTRKQVKALQRLQLLSETKKGQMSKFSIRG